MGGWMTFIYCNAVDEFRRLFNAMRIIADCINNPSRSRQGEVYHSLVIWFEKDRESVFLFLSEKQGFPVVVMNRKTCKRIIHPVRFKGWKRGR